MEPLSGGSLQSGVIILPAVTQEKHFRVPVINKSTENFWLSANTRIRILRLATSIPVGDLVVTVSADEILVSKTVGEFREPYQPLAPEWKQVLQKFPRTEEERELFRTILTRNQDAFAQSDEDCGSTPEITHRIIL